MGNQSSDRKKRLAAALRENLKRRKARARGIEKAPKTHEGEGDGAASAAPDHRPDLAQKPG